MKKSEEALILLSNLAIPSNEKIEKGLGDFLEFKGSNHIYELTKTFLDNNHNFLIKISTYLNLSEITYLDFINNLLEKEDTNDAKYFLEEFNFEMIAFLFLDIFAIA